MSEFVAWSKIPRYFRDIVITEKIDGTNAAVVIEQHPFGKSAEHVDDKCVTVVIGPGNPEHGMPDYEYHVFAQSRKRLITPEDDNYEFARWVVDNARTLVDDLGAGRHFGEWWGKGIQRGYNMPHRVFSLFNVSRHEPPFATPNLSTVPVLYRGPHRVDAIDDELDFLRDNGSVAASDCEEYQPAEGVCIYHTASNQILKVTLENDESPKSVAA